MLYFMSTQLYWSCQRKRANEDAPRGIHGKYWLDRFPAMYGRLRNKSQDRGGDGKGPLEPGKAWDILVKDFVWTKLTYETDRLIAFSGVSQEFSAHFGASKSRIKQPKSELASEIRYMAGLWSHRMPIDLLWFCDKPSSRVTAYVALTWSWGSLNPFAYNNEHDLYDGYGANPHSSPFNFDIAISLVNPDDPFGQISSATLVIDAPISPCILEWRGTLPCITLNSALKLSRVHPDECYRATKRVGLVVLLLVTQLRHQHSLNFNYYGLI